MSQQITMRDVVARYIEVRDKKAEIKQRHKEELAPYNEALRKLEMVFLNHLNKSGTDNFAARGAGTVYRRTVTTVKVADFDAFIGYVREHDAWHLLQQRASQVGVEAVLEDTGALPPGIDLVREVHVGVTKDNTKD